MFPPFPQDHSSPTRFLLPLLHPLYFSSAFCFLSLGTGMNSIFSSAMSIPPEKWVGWRFHPTKFELINNYLKRKTLDNDDEEVDLVIGELKLCEFEPEELLAQSKTKSDEGYFFCPRDFKYSNSQRSNRKTKTGCWKPTGKLVEIKAKRTKKLIGTKRTMVFYKNAHPKPLRTPWVAEEYDYTPDSNLPKKRDFVLIKVKKNPEKKIYKNESTQSATLISLQGEPSHCIVFDCANQIPNEMTATSPCQESALNHHVTSENFNRKEVLVNSPYPERELSHLVACNLDNQNPKEVMAISTDEGWLMASDLENQISFFVFDGECSPPKISSVFENQSPYDGDEGCSSLMASDFENQNPNGTTVNSPCESNRLAVSDFENQISLFEFEGECSSSIEMPSDFKNQSPCNKGELSSSGTSDFENQNLNEIITNSFFIESESALRMASAFKNKNPEELTRMPTYDSEILVSPFEFEGEWSPLLGMYFDFKNQSPYDKGISFDFENKHLEKKIYAQGPEEGKCCPLTETPLDFEFPIPSEPKMSTLEEFYWGHLMAASEKNHLAESMLPELNAQVMEEIEAMHELDNILNSQP